MSLNIIDVEDKKNLREFIKFPFALYKDNPNYVIPIIAFEESTLDSSKNPAFEHCNSRYWVAKKNGNIVGRIAALTIDKELKEKKLARFGWIDFIDDKEVSALLLDTASQWSLQQGAHSIHGPMGFTDLDFEGALISGFNQLTTQATIYNYPYYISHYESWGLETSATWMEIRGGVPHTVPRRITRAASMVKNRFGLRVKHFKKAKEILKYANQIFELLNEAYSHLYGYQQLTDSQISYYIKQYFGFIRKKYVCVVVNSEDEVVGFAICLPSLSKAFNKAKGYLYPLGFIHILKAFYFNKHIDMFLIASKPSYKNMGVNAVIFEHLTKTFIENDIKYVSTGAMLEENRHMLNSFNDYNLEPIEIKRSCFIKNIR